MSWIRILLIWFAVIPASYGQNDARSQKIIEDLSAKFKTYAGVSVDFNAVVTQFNDNTGSDYAGKIWIKKNRYKLEIPDNVIYYDGSKIYQYLPDVNEVNVCQPDINEDDEDFQLLNPQTFFNLSASRFKSNFVRETVLNQRNAYEIDLYPVQVKTTKYSRIRIAVEKNSLEIISLKVYLKDASQYHLTFEKYKILQNVPDSFFTFDKTAHPGVEIIDLTF